MKYTLELIFLKTQVYDCAECYLRSKTVIALIETNKKFIRRGYKIKLYVVAPTFGHQKKRCGKIVSSIYVTDPTKGLFIIGGAVDITLVDKEVQNLMSELFLIILASENLPLRNLSETVRKIGSC
jgi:D-alanyl-D-alanine dipeptidase